ncbi:MAG: DUF6516 family protein [Candidatus Geothermarchaeales archaeon]
MPLSDLEVLRKSKLVKRVVSVDFDGVGETYVLKIRVELKNGWLMDEWEHSTPELRRYSFHVFLGRKMIARWDNAPHFRDIKTFPHHQHLGRQILESEEMKVEDVLSELKRMIA